MAIRSYVVDVAKTEKGAFNPSRAAGTLLKSQVLHLREALLKHNEKLQELLKIDPKSVRSEADVSNYVHEATAILHTHVPSPRRKRG